MADKLFVIGILKVKGSSEQVSERFKKRDFVITIEDAEYPQVIKFQLTQQRCELLDQFAVGQQLKVHFNLRGVKYNDKATGEEKYFNVLESWRIEKLGGYEPLVDPIEVKKEPAINSTPSSEDSFNDLPF